MPKNNKYYALILLIIIIFATSAIIFLNLPSKNTKEDYRMQSPIISDNETLQIPKPDKRLNINEMDNATFDRYIEEITDNFIHIESDIQTYDSKTWYDDYMEMQVNSYYEGDKLYKVNAYDKNMNFEIYYSDNKVVFVLAVPSEHKGQENEKGEIIGYRMFFVENTMIASMDLDANPVDPNSDDFKTMEDFTLRLSFYFLTTINQ